MSPFLATKHACTNRLQACSACMYLQYFSIWIGQGLMLLIALLLAPAKGPLLASALGLISRRLGFFQQVIW